MRVEPHGEGSVLHVLKRGGRGANIVRDESDKKHFLQCLYYLNDEHRDTNWLLSIQQGEFLARPPDWPRQKSLVDVWAWTLMPNHFHLILHERSDGGIAKFMQRVGGSMSARFNAKYQEKGSLFQGSYKARVVDVDADLRWLASYVMVKNTLELYPGGLTKALQNFDNAWRWGSAYPFSSMALYAAQKYSPIIATRDNVLREIFKDLKKFKKDSHDMLKAYAAKRSPENQSKITLE